MGCGRNVAVKETVATNPRTPHRAGRAAVLLAVAVVPVSWNALWPPGLWWTVPGRSLYCAILLAYWWVLLGAVEPGPVSSRGSSRGSSSGLRVAEGVDASSASGEPPTVTGRSATSGCMSPYPTRSPARP